MPSGGRHWAEINPRGGLQRQDIITIVDFFVASWYAGKPKGSPASMRSVLVPLLILGAAGCAPAKPGWCPASEPRGTHLESGSQNLRTGPDAAVAAGFAAVNLALAYASGKNCP